MQKKQACFILAAAALAFTAASPAHAQVSRTWVSGVGDDASPQCLRTAPCKTFAGAISKTSAGGEINCLDPGGFGTVTINKSLTIDCHDVMGHILVTGVPAIIINLDSAANMIVRIRNININGLLERHQGHLDHRNRRQRDQQRRHGRGLHDRRLHPVRHRQLRHRRPFLRQEHHHP